MGGGESYLKLETGKRERKMNARVNRGSGYGKDEIARGGREQLWLTAKTRTQVAEVLGRTHWCELS